MLARGVLTLSLVSTRVVVVLVRLFLALHIGVVSNEVVRVTIVEATLFAPTMPLVHAVIMKLHKLSGNKHQLLTPKRFNLFLRNRHQRDKANIVGKGLAEKGQ